MSDTQWVWFGIMGNFVFGGRFIVQWIASERAGKSVIPIAFWYLSILGSAIILSYGLHKVDPVIILGQLMGFVVYIRNLMLLARRQDAAMEPG